MLTTQYTQGTEEPEGGGWWGRCWEDGDSVMDKILNKQEICDYIGETYEWKPVQAIEKIKLYTLDQGKSETILHTCNLKLLQSWNNPGCLI